MRNKTISKGFFILGTDTDIGKTYVSSVLYKTLLPENVGYYKPIQTGCLNSDDNLVPLDAKFLSNFSNIELTEDMNSYLLKVPVSPHLAAEIDNISINPKEIINKYDFLKEKYNIILVEGAGGVYVPIIRNTYYIFDLIKDLKLPVILVCSSKVGAINHTMLTLNFLNSKNIPVQGIIFNRFTNEVYEKDNIKVVLKDSGIKNYLVINENDKVIDKNLLLNFLYK